jgi:hypothetical protein
MHLQAYMRHRNAWLSTMQRCKHLYHEMLNSLQSCIYFNNAVLTALQACEAIQNAVGCFLKLAKHITTVIVELYANIFLFFPRCVQYHCRDLR